MNQFYKFLMVPVLGMTLLLTACGSSSTPTTATTTTKPATSGTPTSLSPTGGTTGTMTAAQSAAQYGLQATQYSYQGQVVYTPDGNTGYIYSNGQWTQVL